MTIVQQTYDPSGSENSSLRLTTKSTKDTKEAHWENRFFVYFVLFVVRFRCSWLGIL